MSLTFNLGLLATFKYFNFFIDSLNDFLGIEGDSQFSTLDLILPVGISFYTFQTLSYTIDIFKKKLKPTHDFIEFAGYVSFFPQFVAGPIERGISFITSVSEEESF